MAEEARRLILAVQAGKPDQGGRFETDPGAEVDFIAIIQHHSQNVSQGKNPVCILLSTCAPPRGRQADLPRRLKRIGIPFVIYCDCEVLDPDAARSPSSFWRSLVRSPAYQARSVFVRATSLRSSESGQRAMAGLNGLFASLSV